jgi:hypothetical protein
MSAAASAAGEVPASYLYNLSNFQGPVPFSWARLAVDNRKNEIYVSDLARGTVRIFSESGMEIYEFGMDGEPGTVRDVAVDKDGNLLLLSHSPSGDSYAVILCNFRGEFLSKVSLANLPPEFASGFRPEVLTSRQGRLYLADKGAMKILVTDEDGAFAGGYDLGALLGIDEAERRDTGIVGFSVDGDGNLLVTVPVTFQAYRISPDRKVEAFGTRGSSPGKFNVVGGIASDGSGNIYVSDTLRCVVMVFDRDFRFKAEFGYRGLSPGNLVAPMDLAVDGKGRLYVSQSGSRGVSVFLISGRTVQGPESMTGRERR